MLFLNINIWYMFAGIYFCVCVVAYALHVNVRVLNRINTTMKLIKIKFIIIAVLFKSSQLKFEVK